MSTNGAGKIAAEVKKGKRPKHDKRNKLLIPGLNLINSWPKNTPAMEEKTKREMIQYLSRAKLWRFSTPFTVQTTTESPDWFDSFQHTIGFSYW